MSTLPFTRAAYNKPHLSSVGKNRSVIPQIQRNVVADASNCLSRALSATTDTSLNYNLAEANRLIRLVIAARKVR